MEGVRLCMRFVLWLASRGEVASVARGRVRRESNERSRVNRIVAAVGFALQFDASCVVARGSSSATRGEVVEYSSIVAVLPSELDYLPF